MLLVQQHDSLSSSVISSENVQRHYPLASVQQDLWHFHQMAPESSALNIYCGFEFGATVNLDVWRKVWQKIGERHPVLRTTYPLYDGHPVQRIASFCEIKLEVIDVSGWGKDDLKVHITEIADRPFDLEASVLRVHLCQCPDGSDVQILGMHRIAGDMWSCNILLEEFQHLYALEMEVLAGKTSLENGAFQKLNVFS